MEPFERSTRRTELHRVYNSARATYLSVSYGWWETDYAPSRDYQIAQAAIRLRAARNALEQYTAEHG